MILTVVYLAAIAFLAVAFIQRWINWFTILVAVLVAGLTVAFAGVTIRFWYDTQIKPRSNVHITVAASKKCADPSAPLLISVRNDNATIIVRLTIRLAAKRHSNDTDLVAGTDPDRAYLVTMANIDPTEVTFLFTRCRKVPQLIDGSPDYRLLEWSGVIEDSKFETIARLVDATPAPPMKRIARAGEIAKAIAALGSELARFTTGAIEAVDGRVMAKAE